MNHKTTPATADHKVDIFMPIFIGDYLKDTTFLTTEQHGAYLLMLFACWQHGAIPNNDRVICRTTGLSQQAWDDAKSVIVPYFKIIDGKLRHSRIDRELEAAKQKKANFSERGKKGNDARWKSNKESNKESFKDATRNPLATKEGIPNLSPLPSSSTSSLYSESSSTSKSDAVAGGGDSIASKMVAEIFEAIPQFIKLSPAPFLQAIHDAGDNPRLMENHREFISDMSNSLQLPAIPPKKYAAYLQSNGLNKSKKETGVATI